MNRRIAGVAAAVVLAALGTLVLISYVRNAEDRALAGEQTVEVLVASQTIAQGTPSEELAGFVTSEKIPLKVRAEGSVERLSQLEGQVAAVDLLPGEQIVQARFMTPSQVAESSQIDVPDGLQEITISLEPQRAIGGQVKPKDTIGLVASFAPDVMPYASQMILHKLLVTNVQVEQLPPPVPEEAAETTGPELAPTGNLLVTVAVDVAQAERIVFAAEHGSIWLTAEPDSADDGGSRLRNTETIYSD